MFFESDCPFSAEYADTWLSVAKEAPAELTVSAIECHKNRDLCNKLGARRFPTLQYFYGEQKLRYPEMYEKSVDNVLTFFTNAKSTLRPPPPRLPESDL
jgi:thiol-disulfide isomerase/thioredoxin